MNLFIEILNWQILLTDLIWEIKSRSRSKTYPIVTVNEWSCEPISFNKYTHWSKFQKDIRISVSRIDWSNRSWLASHLSVKIQISSSSNDWIERISDEWHKADSLAPRPTLGIRKNWGTTEKRGLAFVTISISRFTTINIYKSYYIIFGQTSSFRSLSLNKSTTLSNIWLQLWKISYLKKKEMKPSTKYFIHYFQLWSFCK